jgi:hypothetical protein
VVDSAGGENVVIPLAARSETLASVLEMRVR